MIGPLTLSLAEWTPQQSIAAKDAVELLQEHPGWEHILAAVKACETTQTADLLRTDPSENGSEYAQKIGYLNGLRELESIALGVVRNGERAEKELRKSELEPVSQGSE